MKELAEDIFEKLKKCKYYIYGGYTTNKEIAEKYTLKYIEKASKTLSIHFVFPKIIILQHFIHSIMNDLKISPYNDKQFMFD